MCDCYLLGAATSAYLIMVGGFTRINGQEVSQRSVDIYLVHAGTVTWSHEGSTAPYPWTNAGRTVHGQDLYLAGGFVWNWWRPMPGVGVYNVTSDTWRVLPNMTTNSEYGPVLFTDGSTLFAADGDTNGDTKPIISLDLTNRNAGWKRPTLSLPFSMAEPNSVVQVKDRVYICGGEYGWPAASQVVSWAHGETSWTYAMPLNVSRAYHCTVTDGFDAIWVIGGCHKCWPWGFMEFYRISTNTWTNLDTVPNLTISTRTPNIQVCTYHEGYIYVVISGGYSSDLDRRFHVYNTWTRTWHVSDTELRQDIFWPAVGTVPIVNGSISA